MAKIRKQRFKRTAETTTSRLVRAQKKTTSVSRTTGAKRRQVRKRRAAGGRGL